MKNLQEISPWVASFPAEIIVCDNNGTILEMNDLAIELYQEAGGAAMIGHNLYDHHVEPARSRVKAVVAQKKTVIYTTEKGGQKKLVCIAPWKQEGEIGGFALLTLDLPEKMKNIVKD